MASITPILMLILLTATSITCKEISITNFAGVIPGTNRLYWDKYLKPGDILNSADGESSLRIRGDCNVVLERNKGGRIWQSRKHLDGENHCVLMLIEGVLSVRKDWGLTEIWRSNNAPLTVAPSTSYLEVEPTALVIYDNVLGNPIWHSFDQP